MRVMVGILRRGEKGGIVVLVGEKEEVKGEVED